MYVSNAVRLNTLCPHFDECVFPAQAAHFDGWDFTIMAIVSRQPPRLAEAQHCTGHGWIGLKAAAAWRYLLTARVVPLARRYLLTVATRERVSVDLDTEVAAILRTHAADAHATGGLTAPSARRPPGTPSATGQ